MQKLDKCLSAERVALRGYRKAHTILGILLTVITVYLAACFNDRRYHRNKAAPVICERNSTVRAVEHRYAKLLFNLGNRR